MDGFPPAPDRLVTLANWRKAPFSAWGFRNVRRLVPTADIAASGHASPFETSLEDIGDVGFAGHDGKPTTLGHALGATNTDAFIVLRRGRIAAEWYGPGMTPPRRISCFPSANRSAARSAAFWPTAGCSIRTPLSSTPCRNSSPRSMPAAPSGISWTWRSASPSPRTMTTPKATSRATAMPSAGIPCRRAMSRSIFEAISARKGRTAARMAACFTTSPPIPTCSAGSTSAPAKSPTPNSSATICGGRSARSATAISPSMPTMRCAPPAASA